MSCWRRGYGVGAWRKAETLAQLTLAGDSAADCRLSGVELVLLYDFVGADVGGKLGDAANDETEKNDADELEYKQKTPTGVGGGSKVAEADGQDGLDIYMLVRRHAFRGLYCMEEEKKTKKTNHVGKV